MAARKPKVESTTDAIALLERDHAELDAMFERFEASRDPAREDIVEHLCRSLTVHATIEAELLYPAAHAALDDDSRVFVAEIEHGCIRDLVELIEVLPVEDPRFAASVSVLGEQLRHHVKLEEKQLFAKLRRTDLDLEVLGRRLEARRLELLAEGFTPDDPGVSDEEGDDDADPDLARRRRVGYASSH